MSTFHSILIFEYEMVKVRNVCCCRAALSPKASPRLINSGATLSADFMKSGLAINDKALLSRLMGMMTGPLAPENTQQQVNPLYTNVLNLYLPRESHESGILRKLFWLLL